ncbi:LacI family DNA-binding transcriptional regulator [Bacillus sp. CGMCC 1.60114]|uniref:LacI family DNA-binding transcriptional regulator n=1 Tax=unclassified Bacillus (in: firmicutes) TaxID=185979 RepID=UPI003630F14C
MKPTLEDVALHAGVSPTTVSRVLNNRGYISKETRKRVYESMKAINYFPNEMARSLLAKQSHIIGLIFPTVSNPFFGELIFNIEMICEELGYKVFLCNSLNHVDKEKKYLDMLLRNQVDGIIVGSHNRGIFDQVITSLPIVAVDQFISESAPIVSSNNYLGGKLATEHLIKKGCKKIIHISGPIRLDTPTHLRSAAYKDVMEANGFEPIIYETVQTFNHTETDELIKRVLQENPDVDGIFASDDIFAANLHNKALQIGINVPDELKIVGYDGTETVRKLFPQLTTIKQPISEMAEIAVKILVSKIKNEEILTNLNKPLDVSLVEGSTT